MPDNMKRKHLFSNRVLINAWGCALALIMLGAGLTLGIAGAVIFGPQLLNYDATSTALAERAVQLGATEADLVQRDRDANARQTDIARAAMATDAYLQNNQLLLQQTATQSDRDIRATQTIRAVQNAQRRTQIALEATSTQAQLQRQATDSALAFQQTRTALGDDITITPDSATSESIVPQQVASVMPPVPATSMSEAVPTVTPTYLIPPSDTPYATPDSLLLEASFAQGYDESVWQTAMDSDWFADTDGVQATRDQAWLLSEEDFGGDYQMTVQMTPRSWLNESYWLLFGVTDERGFALRYRVEDDTIQQVTLYQFDEPRLADDVPLVDDTAFQLETESVSYEFSETVTLQITLNRGLLSAVADETVLMETALPIDAGRIGVQVAAGTELTALRVEQVTR